MSFADGLESGINLSLKISTLQLQKEQEERLRNQYALDAVTAQSTIQKNLLEAKKTEAEIDELNYKNTDAYRRRQEAVIESNMNWRDTVSENIRQDTAEGKKIAERNQNVEDWNLVSEFLSSAQNWASNPELVDARKSNSPAYQGWQNNSLKIMSYLADQGIELGEYADPRYMQAVSNLSAILEPNGSDLNLEDTDLTQYSSDITTVFRPKLGSYLGKQYKDSQGNEGEIIDIRMTGEFPAVDDGTKAIIGAEYTVQTASGEKKKITGFLPDRATSVITGEIDPTDAVAVSVADLIDQTAVGKTIFSMMLDTPGTLEVMQEITALNSSRYFPPDLKFEKLILETAEEIRDQSNIDIEDKKRTINLTTFSQLPYDSDDIEDMRTVDRSLNILAQNFDGFRDYLEKKSIGKEDFLRLPKGETIDGIIDKTKVSVEESLRIARSSTRIPSGVKTSSVRSPRTYDFTVGDNNLQISRDEPSAQFLPKLRQQYGDEIINNAIEDIRTELSKTYDGDVMDNDFALLSELYYYLGSRRRR